MNRNEFIRMLKEAITKNPEFIGDALKIVSEHWKELERVQRERRDSKHQQSVDELIQTVWSLHIAGIPEPKLFSRLETVTMLDAIDAVNPDCNESSVQMQQMLKHLFNSVVALNWHPEDYHLTKVAGRSELVSKLLEKYSKKS